MTPEQTVTEKSYKVGERWGRTSFSYSSRYLSLSVLCACQHASMYP